MKFIYSLISANYDKLISKIYINFDLREDDLNNNNLPEKDINILKELIYKLGGNGICKEKKKKGGNKTNKDGIGLLFSLYFCSTFII